MTTETPRAIARPWCSRGRSKIFLNLFDRENTARQSANGSVIELSLGVANVLDQLVPFMFVANDEIANVPGLELEPHFTDATIELRLLLVGIDLI